MLLDVVENIFWHSDQTGVYDILYMVGFIIEINLFNKKFDFYAYVIYDMCGQGFPYPCNFLL